MKRKSNKKLTIALLALLGVVSTAGTYAYWYTGVVGAKNSIENTITIGEGKAVKTKIILTGATDEEKPLVPANYIEDYKNEDGTYSAVKEIEYTYFVEWKSDNTNHGDKVLEVGTLSATAKVADTSTDAAKALVQITEFTPAEIYVNQSAVSVSFKITLEEPVDKDQYLEVINEKVTIDVEFSIAVA